MAPRQPLPALTEDDLIDLAGGATVLLAKQLVLKGKVKKAIWAFRIPRSQLEPALHYFPAQ